jgi:arylsulfatase A-like enzyme
LPDQWNSHRVDRRTFLKAGVAGAAAVGAGAGIWAATQGGRRRPRPGAPNILVLVVDQMRTPTWFGAGHGGAALPPHLAALRRGAVAFGSHYTVSNDCTPSRSALVTGLYTHQTGCLLTGGSTLYPGFPTWGTMLREHGYDAYWYGKWHLTHGDNHWNAAFGGPLLAQYGFAGGTFPSPNGAPGQGWHADPHIVDQFREWFAQEGAGGPWCTTVSLVNPHDIAWWYRRTNRQHAERSAPRAVASLPPNFETPAQLAARRKPALQHSLQETSAQAFGPVPFSGPNVEKRWLPFLDLYVKLQRAVDDHIGHVMRILHSNPQVAANTVVVFTADHGEYGASHGLRGKGAAVYEEGIRVPLLVKDPRGKLTRAPERVRTQLTSSVDVAPLLLTIATGSEHWRREPRYAHIADRPRLERLLADPHAPGRPYVLHATDEVVTEFADELYSANAPLHIVSMRTPAAKYAIYSHWPGNGTQALALGQERELYDYRTRAGRLELDNVAGRSPLEARMQTAIEHALAAELHAPLSADLAAARAIGFEDYLSMAKRAVVQATRRRRRLAERLARLEARQLAQRLAHLDARGNRFPTPHPRPPH